MLFRMTFRRTREGYLRVAIHSDEDGINSVVLCSAYPHFQVFKSVLQIARLGSIRNLELEAAAREAWEQSAL